MYTYCIQCVIVIKERISCCEVIVLDNETTLALASLIGKKMKENYWMNSKDATEALIKDLREFDRLYGEELNKYADR